MIQIHGNTILSMGFNLIIKAHDSNPWQIIYQKAQFSLAISKSPIFIGNIQKPNSRWQHQKTQFSLAILKSLIFNGNIKSLVLSGNIKKPSFHQQYQKAQFSLTTSKTQFSLATSKAQFSLTISKAQFTLVLFYQKPKIINAWQEILCFFQMNNVSKTLLWQKPWQSFYKSSRKVILKIMILILYYKPMNVWSSFTSQHP